MFNQIDKKSASEKVMYELDMLRKIYNIDPPEQMKDNLVFKNIVLESFLLHARNLLCFFLGSKYPDDIKAEHFISQDDTKQVTSKLCYLWSNRNNLNKHLSHLTHARIVKKIEWELPKIKNEIEEAYKKFLTFIPEQERSALTFRN